MFFFLISIFSVLLLLINIDKKKNKILFYLFYPLNFLFFLFEGISILIIGNSINYQFLVNIFLLDNYYIAFTSYKWYFIGFLLFMTSINLVFCYFIEKFSVKNSNSGKILDFKKDNNEYIIFLNKYLRYFLIIVYTLILFNNNGAIFNFVKVLIDNFYIGSEKLNNLPYNGIYKNLTGYNYLEKKDIKAEFLDNKKNLVVIFLESFEYGFLKDENFIRLTKNIQKLAENNEFYYNIPQINGSEWTIAGIHTVYTGIPFLFNLSSKLDCFDEECTTSLNKSIINSNINKKVCFSNILKKLGYNQTYIGGVFKEYSGKDSFFKLCGFDKIYGVEEIKKEFNIENIKISKWGVRDIDLFEFAKVKYKELSKSGTPFNLTMETNATHGLEGIFDERCKNNDKNNFLNTIECTDNNLQNFINFLQKQTNYKDTLIVILPDHLAFSPYVKKIYNRKHNSLYAIFINSGNKEKYDNKILYTDLSSIILDKMKIKHNFVFLTSKIKDSSNNNKILFLNNNSSAIKAFNNKISMSILINNNFNN